MTGNYPQTDEKQIMVQELKEARKEIAALKEKAKKDINKLWEKFEDYNSKRKKFESEIDGQAKQREERTSSQFSWGQAVNFVPIFSHAYSLATTRVNESIESAESRQRELLRDITEDAYKEFKGSYEEIIKYYDQEQD